MIVETYFYDLCNDITYDNGQLSCTRTYNMPMNRKLIKIHKGSDNKISFRVRNLDLKLVDLSTFSIKAKFVNKVNNEKILEKYLDNSTNKGFSVLTVFEGDLVNIPPGFYQLILQKENNQQTTDPDVYSLDSFYSDQADNIEFDVEITGQGDTVPFPTIEILYDNFIPLADMSQENTRRYITSAIPCNAMRNHLNSNHTFSLLCEAFSGKVRLYGSLDTSPPSSFSEYFPLDFAPSQSVIEYTEFTGLDPFTFSANIMWVKFAIYPDVDSAGQEVGKISKIQWRS